MKHSKDPFEAAIEEEQEESPPESPAGGGDDEEGRLEIEQAPEESERDVGVRRQPKKFKSSVAVADGKNKDEDEEEEEENMEAELTKYPTTADPAKMAKMQVILSQFTEDQMSRYESFRRSAFQKGNMRKLLQGVTGSQKISMPVIIVNCGIAKMFVGELVETARVVMGERNDSGPIRPCHIRESYRRLKLEGKAPKRSVPHLFAFYVLVWWTIYIWFQRVSPDVLPLTNGAKKPYLRPSPSRSPHEDTTTTITPNSISGKGFNGGSCTSLDGARIRSSQQTDPAPTKRGGDVLLQWGQRKRSRVSRAEIRSSTTTATAAPDDSSSSSGHGKIQSNKLLRRSVYPSMPPPPPPPPHPVSSNRSSNHRNGFAGGKQIFLSRNQEDRSANGSPSRTINNGRTVSRSGGSKRSPPSPDQIEKRSSLRDHHHQNQRPNGFHHNHNQQHQRVNRSESTAQAHPELETNNNGEREKATQVEVTEWPRIYIALSRKEKEEDFLVMKGTKLPHRPRKRAKNIDKSLQFCFPGLWLSDLPKNRYDVREKKNVKKQQQKRRGLKGMEDLDTDSE
uniref:TAFII28-like protein domain-containing protein n=1 Tax=Brassica oleracea var. oleracea TaxID=109376 RepID=A0A0D3A4L0_BRAOL